MRLELEHSFGEGCVRFVILVLLFGLFTLSLHYSSKGGPSRGICWAPIGGLVLEIAQIQPCRQLGGPPLHFFSRLGTHPTSKFRRAKFESGPGTQRVLVDRNLSRNRLTLAMLAECWREFDGFGAKPIKCDSDSTIFRRTSSISELLRPRSIDTGPNSTTFRRIRPTPARFRPIFGNITSGKSGLISTNSGRLWSIPGRFRLARTLNLFQTKFESATSRDARLHPLGEVSRPPPQGILGCLQTSPLRQTQGIYSNLVSLYGLDSIGQKNTWTAVREPPLLSRCRAG